MATFSLTYDVITPESAEHGDTAESGFAYGLEHAPLVAWAHVKRAKSAAQSGQAVVSLKRAIRYAIDHGCTEDNGNGSFYGAYLEAGTDREFRTGERTCYAAHFDGLTPSTLARVARAIGAR